MNARAIVLAMIALLPPIAARAQEDVVRPQRAWAGGGLLIASPVGEFDDYVDAGWGVGGHFVLRVDESGVFGIRLDAGYLNYGRETRRVCLSPTVGCRIEVDLTTSNDIAYVNLGPQLTVARGPLQPYVNASLGFAYFATVSSVEGSGNSNEPFARTTNFDDITFAWQLGSGMRIPVSSGRTPILLDFGVRYNTNGEAEYLREGGIIDRPDGSIDLNPIRSEANLVTIQIGVTVGIRW
ncbi:MAG: hypothetical protein L0271_24665 [Gemmatimonadetes bacterium]|nr:hypothetical protein [Gemmatimonadota bacterium]